MPCLLCTNLGNVKKTFRASLVDLVVKGQVGRGNVDLQIFADQGIFSETLFNCLIYVKNIFTVTNLPKRSEITFCHHCYNFVIKT